MKSAKTGAVSGCILWVLVFGILCMCLFPVTMVVGSITSTVTGDSVARILGPRLCPAGSTAEIFTYETTTTDENGFETPTTAYEMRCVDANGNIVKDLGPTYAFIWMGILGGIGLILSAVLAFLLAAPAGALIARVFQKKQTES
jgi:hypothetical protein